MLNKPPEFDFSQYLGLSDPNWTQVPDEVLDFMLPSLSGAEVKAFLYILRRTYGFKRDADRITLAQLCNGLKRNDGEYLDFGTGLSRRAVIEAVKGLETKGLIQVARGTTPEGTTDVNVYRVRQAADARVQKSNPPHAETALPRVQKSNPPRVQKSNPHNEGLGKRALGKKEQQQQQPFALQEEDPTGAGEPRTAVVVASQVSTSEQPTADDLGPRLSALGVAASTAEGLVRQYSLVHIYRWVCYAEHRLAAGWMPRETPAAWLVSAIRSGDWVIPEWFKTPEEGEAASERRSEEAVAESKQQELDAEEERQAAEAQRRDMERDLGIGESTRAMWEKAKALLEERKQLSPALFSAYLLPVRGGKAVIATPVEFFRGVIESRGDEIRAALEEVSGRGISEIEVRHIVAGAE